MTVPWGWVAVTTKGIIVVTPSTVTSIDMNSVHRVLSRSVIGGINRWGVNE